MTIATMTLLEKADAVAQLRTKLIWNLSDEEKQLLADAEEMYRRVADYEVSRRRLYAIFED